jgi:hypothetical protein
MSCAYHIEHQAMRHPSLNHWQIQRLRIFLRISACSETWVEDQIITRVKPDDDGEGICITAFDPRIFPPGGKKQTKMKWCRSCGRFTPPQNLALIEHRHQRFGPVFSATLHCDDCRIYDDYEQHQELYEAGLHLRPSGSQSFVTRRMLHRDRLSKNS